MARTPRAVAAAEPDTVPLRHLAVKVLSDAKNGAVEVKQLLPYLNVVNGDSVSHVFTLEPRMTTGDDNQGSPTLTVPAGQAQAVPTLPFAKISVDTPNASVFLFYSDVPIAGPRSAPGGGNSFVGFVTTVTAGVDDGFEPLPAGNTNQLTGFSSEASTQTQMHVSGKISKLSVKPSSNTSNGNTVITLRKNGADTALIVTVPAGSNSLVEDTTDSVSFVAGDTLCWHVNAAGSAGTAIINALAMVTA